MEINDINKSTVEAGREHRASVSAERAVEATDSLAGLLLELTEALSERSITVHVFSDHDQKWEECGYAACSEMRELIERATKCHRR